MSEAKHTPGPWYAAEGEYDDEFEVLADGKAICIAQPPTEADANLIAAAPDMLAALQYIVGWNPGDWSSEVARDMACAAIAKATGS